MIRVFSRDPISVLSGSVVRFAWYLSRVEVNLVFWSFIKDFVFIGRRLNIAFIARDITWETMKRPEFFLRITKFCYVLSLYFVIIVSEHSCIWESEEIHMFF